MSGALQPPLCRCLSAARAGGTLVEVMVSCLILAVIAVATAACLYYAREQTSVQRNRRTAMELANSRLEEIRGAPYSDVSPSSHNYDTNFLDRMSGSWRLSNADQGETVTIGGRTRPITTTVQYMDVDGGSATYDGLRIAVSVGYSGGAEDVVRLATIRSP